ncbi:helix-turn-helix domain-containing protein [Paenibacillus contaminans]|uniref:HTH araC/xylS-type domain-containing protein n=1 Tax=Paenibacillus contaminans TaxID=450362 RepID=A0A329LU73_9BACL|nr:AraC family transcriptional regulator [Paenibacillus contaminans]RAV08307.1 hypothetical protein DQG23_41270 [Paenibacillus contaminans]
MRLLDGRPVLRRIGLTSHSLFVRLLASFLIIILLLGSFIIFSVVFYRDSMKQDIIKYNTLNLRNTTSSYENQFELIQKAVLTFSLGDKVQQINTERFDYYTASTLIDDIQHFLSNPFLYLDNLLLLYKGSSFALEKSRGYDAVTMFSRYNNNPSYPYAFWKEQFDEQYKVRILPSSVFAEVDWEGRKSNERTLIPIVVKNKMYADMYAVAMIDAQKIYKAFHRSINDNFYILNGDHQSYFSSRQTDIDALPDFEDPKGFIKEGKNYYFYEKGETTGLTYVNIIPDEHIYSEIGWNFTFVFLLILSIVISVIVSLLFSMKLNRPVKRIVDSLAAPNVQTSWKSDIKEFAFIHEKVSHFLQANHDIHQDLAEKTSLLRYYAYTNKLKKIRSNLNDLQDLVPGDRSFVMLLFQLAFKTRFHKELLAEEERATFYITEYINHVMLGKYEDSLTFQMENDQILSIVSAEGGEIDMTGVLDTIKQVLDLEKDYCFLTIAVSSRSNDLNAAYKSVLELLKTRKYNDCTQIIYEAGTFKETNVLLSPPQESEFHTHLINANDDLLLQIVVRMLNQLKKKDAPALQVAGFADSLLHHIQNTLLARSIDTRFLQHYQEKLTTCHSFAELEKLFCELLPIAARSIRDKVEKRDHIIEFVHDYLKEHYDRDITLDILADKLNITRSYLSTYFKEKTGVYFVDYVNSVRINKAKELLALPDIKIQETAAQVGYQNINSFNRMFKKFTGVTPSEFRKAEIVNEGR